MWILSKYWAIYFEDNSWIVKILVTAVTIPVGLYRFSRFCNVCWQQLQSCNGLATAGTPLLPPYRPQDSKVAVSVVWRQTLLGEKTISIYYFTSIRQIQFFSPQILKYITAQIDNASFSQKSQGVFCLVLWNWFWSSYLFELIWSSLLVLPPW